MATAIPTYQQRATISEDLPAARAQSAVSANSPIGDALSNIGHRGSLLAGELLHEQTTELKRQQEETAKAWAGNAVPDLTIKLSGLMDDMKSQATGAATGFTPEYLAKFDNTAKASIAMAPDDKAKRYLTEHLQSLRTTLGLHAQKFEADATRSNRVDLADKASDNWASIVARDPKQLRGALTAIDQTLPDVGPEMREKLADSARKKLLGAAAGTSVQTDPGGTFAAINKALNIPEPVAPNPSRVAASVENLSAPVQRVVAAFFGQESNSGQLDTSQPNYGGARGPMQVTEATFNGVKAQGLIPANYQWANPDHSSEAGVALIQSLYGKYNGDVKKIAAAYYAGEKAVNADGTINDYKDLKNPKAPSTLQYADQIAKRLGGASGAAPLVPLTPVELRPGETPAKTGIDWIDAMTPAELLHYRQQAHTEMQRASTLARHGLERTERDLQAQAIAGVVPQNVPNKDQYVAAFGPVDGMIRYKENVADVVSLGQGIATLQTASPQDRAAIIASAKPVAGDGFAATAEKQQKLQQASAIIDKQLKDDPATYVSKNSPRVNEAFNQLRSLPPTASPQEQRAAVDNYAAQSLAEQTRLGATRPQLLSDGQAAAITQRFLDQKEGGQNSAQIIDGLQQQWGSYFPTIFQQLQRDDKLPADAMVIPSMKDTAAKERMARLALVTDKELKERMEPGMQKDLDSRLLSTMEPFWNTLALQGGGERTYAAVKRSTERLAMSYMAGGKSVGDSVKQAFDETVGHGYQFEKTYRVPKTELPEQVVQGLSGIKRHLEDLPLIVPPATPGMKPEDAQKQYLDSIKSNAVFATDPNEGGLLLYVNTERGLKKVMGPAGQISFSWKQLRDEYQTMQGQAFIGYPKR